MMQTVFRKTFLLTELNVFEASTNRTASQDSSLYIACIACMIDSLPASCPVQTCGNPTDVIMFPRMCVTTTLPAIERNTLPIPICLIPGLSSSGINRRARKTSMDND